ncbi:MAG TPA: hypothetical protein HA298_03140 [Methanobacteriales archaeon]|nr:MAG: Cell surface glycoprotein (S-layer protein) related protein [Methanobacteriaceae archaeon 41_258]MDI3484015.1 hypothetical protein [Methanobacteriaceae archaeon]HIH61670.1 hypothetical protein [Methanobacteriales archaeon]
MAITQRHFMLTDSQLTKKTLNIMGYGSAIVTFNTLLRTAGTYTIGIDDSPTTITVLEPAKFIIQSFQVTPSGCGAFNHKSHSHDKKNVGDIAGNYMARLYVQGTAVANKIINIASNSNTTVTFDYTITQRGNYSIWIENSTRLNVNVLQPATFKISNFTVTPRSGSEPLNVTVTVNIIPVILRGNTLPSSR